MVEAITITIIRTITITMDTIFHLLILAELRVPLSIINQSQYLFAITHIFIKRCRATKHIAQPFLK
jgi:hypothetical protein